MRTLTILLVAIGAIYLPRQAVTQDSADRIPLDVLYLGRRKNKVRSAAFVDFLTDRFQRCIAVDRYDFEPGLLRGIDVVVLDWSAREWRPKNYASPVGPLEGWATPTVLVGGAGYLIAGPWQVIGGAG